MPVTTTPARYRLWRLISCQSIPSPYYSDDIQKLVDKAREVGMHRWVIYDTETAEALVKSDDQPKLGVGRVPPNTFNRFITEKR